MENILASAKIFRSEVKNNLPSLSWTPQPSELTTDKIKIPSMLMTFYDVLLTGKVNGAKTCRLKSSCQDVSFAVSKVPSPKQALLPFAIKSLTGNVELIKILNRLGHGVSYSKQLKSIPRLFYRK